MFHNYRASAIKIVNIDHLYVSNTLDHDSNRCYSFEKALFEKERQRDRQERRGKDEAGKRGRAREREGGREGGRGREQEKE